METFLVLNRLEIKAMVDEQELTILALAAGELDSPNGDASRTACFY
jgi:death on curing protein